MNKPQNYFTVLNLRRALRLFRLLFLKIIYRGHFSFPLKSYWNIHILNKFELFQYDSMNSKLVLKVKSPVRIDRNVLIKGSSTVSLGRNVVIGRQTIIECNEKIEIGNDVMIAENVSIRDTDHSFSDLNIPMIRQKITTKPVKIEDDVWIGFGVAITKGVTISRGSVVGANSVVTHDIPPYAIAAGVPARIIKKRGEKND